MPEGSKNDSLTWTSIEAWQSLLNRLKVDAREGFYPAPKPTDEEMNQYEAACHFKFPISYRKFLAVFGPGDVGGHYPIYSPNGPMRFNLAQFNAEAYREYDFVQEEFAQLESLTRMVFFGSNNADMYGWDPEDVTDRATNEYAVYELLREGELRKIAGSFPEFINDVLLGDRNGIYRADGGFPQEFRPAMRWSGEPEQEEAPAEIKPLLKPIRSSIEERDLLFQILKYPEEPEHGLTYAEWLSTHGDPFAELIRVQSLLLSSRQEERSSLLAQETQLLGRADNHWGVGSESAGPFLSVLKRLGAGVWVNPQGYTQQVIMNGGMIFPRCIKYLANYSGLRHVHLMHHQVTSEDLTALLKLVNLEKLTLNNAHLTDDALEPLAGLKDLKNLRNLELNRNAIVGPGLRFLQGLTQLERLDLSQMHTNYGRSTSEGMIFLKGLINLKELNLMWNGLPGDSLQYLRSMTHLESLYLQGNKVRNEDLVHLWPLISLKTLHFDSAKGITAHGLKELARAGDLESLNLRLVPVGDEGMSFLEHLTKLKYLDLSATPPCQISDVGAACLQNLSQLEWLKLSGNRLTDAGLQHLAGMNRLWHLDLNGNDVTDNGLSVIGRLTHLRVLDLSFTKVTDAGLEELRDLSELEILSLHYCEGVTEQGKAKLRMALPKCKSLN